MQICDKMVGMKIGEYLQSRNESVGDFCDRIGISRATYYRGDARGDWSAKVIRKIVHGTGGVVMPNDLFGFTAKRKRAA